MMMNKNAAYRQKKKNAAFFRLMIWPFQVIIRLRPLSSSEISVQGPSRCVKQESSQTITWTGHPESRFTFDIVADESVSQVFYVFQFMI